MSIAFLSGHATVSVGLFNNYTDIIHRGPFVRKFLSNQDFHL